jgi:hypothetical protein
LFYSALELRIQVGDVPPGRQWREKQLRSHAWGASSLILLFLLQGQPNQLFAPGICKFGQLQNLINQSVISNAFSWIGCSHNPAAKALLTAWG